MNIWKAVKLHSIIFKVSALKWIFTNIYDPDRQKYNSTMNTEYTMSSYHLLQLLSNSSTLQTSSHWYQLRVMHLHLPMKPPYYQEMREIKSHLAKALTMLVPFIVADGNTIDENTFGWTNSYLSSYWSCTVSSKQNPVWLYEVKLRQLMLGNIFTAASNECESNSPIWNSH